MNRNGSLLHLCRPTIWTVCSLFLLFVTSCHKPGPTQPLPGPDTTSHNFTWSVDVIGNGGGILRDVAIINDTLAYAAGGIYLQDSTGYVDPNAYNFFRWNGQTWTMLRLQFYTACGQPGRSSYPTGSVLCFGPNDIWIATDGNEITHWNGNSQDTTYCLGSQIPSIRKLWGKSSQSIFAVCELGTFLHFDGNTWQTISTGTTLALIDVYGTADNNLWIAGLDLTTGQSSVLLHWDGYITRKAFEMLPPLIWRNDTISGGITSVWTSDPNAVWVCAAGEYLAPLTTHGEAKLLWFQPVNIGFTWRIRGSNSNNVFVVGDYNTIVHYNGSSWHLYTDIMNFSSPTSFRAVDVRNGVVFIVGSRPGGGIVYRGRAD